MIPRRVRLAVLIAFLCHGLFVVTARYRLSYDAYTHMLFANHYASDWFSLWETRWYTGFTVVSYPPLTHQLIALFVPFLGFDKAYALILWSVVTAYPLGVYTFGRIFTGRSAASYAALASAVLLPIYVTAYIFGQLPFLTSTLFALFSAASLARYLREGSLRSLALTIALTTTTMAAHHATLLVQPFFALAAATSQINKNNWRTILVRLVPFLVLAVLAGLLVIWPFWQWGIQQTMQTPIDHSSRHNFLTDPSARNVFFWPLYGPLLAFLPFVFYKNKWPSRFRGLITSFIVLFLLGLGGTTPLPWLLFGKNWEWLTYDRFAFWACLILTLLSGILFISFKRRLKNRILVKPIPILTPRSIITALTFSVFAATGLGSWLTPILFPVQPEPIDMKPIVKFLNQDSHYQYRYLTFGFGDQFAYLNLLTKATTIDGSYHTARTLPELRESGVGQVDSAYWASKGIPVIRPILQESGEHGVRWGFVNRKEFIPELKRNGWVFLKLLSNGIQLWENPEAILPQASKPPPVDRLASFSWGVFPLLAFISASALGTLCVWPVEAEKILRGVYAFLIGLIPIGLSFWYYRILGEFSHSRVYFTYDHALFFLSDAFALIAVLLWSAWRINNFKGTLQGAQQHRSLISPKVLLFAVCVLASLSSLWSTDWRTSLYTSLHLWLVFGLFLSLRDWTDAWKPLMIGFCAALGIQIVTGYVEFATQSTALLSSLGMNWPGQLDPSIRGASIVQLPNSISFLRAYGTLPHPNILGGFGLVFLLGPAALFLRDEKPNLIAPLLFSLGIVLLALTFSRSAWLGLFGFITVLIWKSKYLDRKLLITLIIVSTLSFTLTLLPFRELVLARTAEATSHSEQFSTIARVWLTQEALQMLQQYPLAGVGIGSFVLELAKHAGEGYIIEPVHNLFLLAGAELGSAGLLLVIGLAVSLALRLGKAKTTNSILAGAVITGIGVISLFDHYFWTLAPGRLLLGLVMGLLAGQLE